MTDTVQRSNICKIKNNLQMDVEGGGRGSVDGNMPYFLGQIRSNLKRTSGQSETSPT